MTCYCLSKRKSGGFSNWQDYQSFESLLQNDKGFNEVSVDSFYSDVGLIEKWYECLKCRQKWRLVEPDPPFKGLWEKIKT